MSYGVDLEVLSHGAFSLKIVDPERFVRNYIPANTNSYSFSEPRAKSQILSEFTQSYSAALNSLSSTYRISQLPSQGNKISEILVSDSSNAETWKDRFGFALVRVGIEHIEATPESLKLIKQFSGIKMFTGLFKKTSIVASQQKNMDDQHKAVKKLKELLDAGILTQEEFDTKKKEILGL